MSCFHQICFLLLLQCCVGADVFLQSQDAKQLLNRPRRANSPFEELRKGNMERECREERCSREEAREIFEDEEKTNEFWNIYFDGNSCDSNPCINNGVCKDGIGKYTCFCSHGFQGPRCEFEIKAQCENSNGECQHFCKVEKEKVECSCADGYYLAEDGKSCQSNEPYKCGVLKGKYGRTVYIHKHDSNTTHPDNGTQDVKFNHGNISTSDRQQILTITVQEDVIEPEFSAHIRIVNGDNCDPGECPWQALLVNEEDIGFCGGTILTKYFILSAAHCMNQSRSFYIVLGEFDREMKEGHEAKYLVDQVMTHKQYVKETYNNDIALIKLQKPITFTDHILPACLPDVEFAEKVLMRQDSGRISGFGRVREGGRQSTKLQKLTVPYVDRAVCIESSQFKITNRMFCAGYDLEAKDACQGDSGGPHVTQYKGTWFVTGVVSWGEGCAREGKYGVYTQVSKFIPWIRFVVRKY